jgi:nitrogen fixation protein NifX
MSYKIAFASSDGKIVNQNFVMARKFLIFRIKKNSAEFLELRENAISTNGFEYLDEAVNKSVELISDCKVIYVSRIGYGALKVLADKKITVFEYPFFISDIIGRILSSNYEI